jgi:hypothetical protein
MSGRMTVLPIQIRSDDASNLRSNDVEICKGRRYTTTLKRFAARVMPV